MFREQSFDFGSFCSHLPYFWPIFANFEKINTPINDTVISFTFKDRGELLR